MLDNELTLIDDCIDITSTVPIGGGSTTEQFYVDLPQGGGNASLQNVLALRATGVMMEVGVPDPNSPTTGTPPTNPPHDFPAVPEFSFYNYDHPEQSGQALGNTRVLYHNYFISCTPGGVRYPDASGCWDYYPYGRSLREYTLTRDRFQTTYHERDEESGLDYRGARFYDGDFGVFLSVDPLAAKYAAWSTYNYVLGNPINIIDPSGLEPELTGTSAAYSSFEEQEEKKTPIIDIHIVNAAKMKDEDLNQIYRHIVNIYDDNGFSEKTFNFHTYSEGEGKKIGILDYKELFLALVESTEYAYRNPGLSTPSSVGRTSTFNKETSVFESYVNVGVVKSWNPRNINWAIGLLASHELLHQLDFQSGYLYYKGHRESKHIDSNRNLLQTGYWLQNYACKNYIKCNPNHLIHSELVKRIAEFINN